MEETIARLKKESELLHKNKPSRPTKPREPVLKKESTSKTNYPPMSVKVSFSDAWKAYIKEKWKKYRLAVIIGVIIGIVGAVLCGVGYQTLNLIIYNIGKPLTFVGGATFQVIWIFLLISVFKTFGKRNEMEKAEEERIKSSPEYIRECQRIDVENHQKQVDLDEKLKQQYENDCERYQLLMQNYNEAVQQYETDTLPAWQEECSALQTALTDTNNSLQELYNRNVIPVPYQSRPALLYLASFLGTSDYDMKFAIERYDTYVMQRQQREQIDLQRAQLELMNETLENQQTANWLNQQMLEMTEQGNETLHSISNWQKADMATREFRRIKARRAARKAGR